MLLGSNTFKKILLSTVVLQSQLHCNNLPLIYTRLTWGVSLLSSQQRKAQKHPYKCCTHWFALLHLLHSPKSCG